MALGYLSVTYPPKTAQEYLRPVLAGSEILKLQETVRKVPVTDEVIRYVLWLTRATRVTKPEAVQWKQNELQVKGPADIMFGSPSAAIRSRMVFSDHGTRS